MSRKLFTLVALVMVLILAASCSPKPTELTASDADKTLEFKTGDTIVVTLEGNPTTGYTWEAKDLDTSMLQQEGDPNYKSSNPDLVGAGGTQSLTFKALKAGSVTLTLIYHRSWETGVEPLKTFTVTLTVK